LLALHARPSAKVAFAVYWALGRVRQALGATSSVLRCSHSLGQFWGSTPLRNKTQRPGCSSVRCGGTPPPAPPCPTAPFSTYCAGQCLSISARQDLLLSSLSPQRESILKVMTEKSILGVNPLMEQSNKDTYDGLVVHPQPWSREI
jgi:hypothetical protein